MQVAVRPLICIRFLYANEYIPFTLILCAFFLESIVCFRFVRAILISFRVRQYCCGWLVDTPLNVWFLSNDLKVNHLYRCSSNSVATPHLSLCCYALLRRNSLYNFWMSPNQILPTIIKWASNKWANYAYFHTCVFLNWEFVNRQSHALPKFDSIYPFIIC